MYKMFEGLAAEDELLLAEVKMQMLMYASIFEANYFYDISGFTERDLSIYEQFLAYIQKDQLIQFGVNMEAMELANVQKDFIEKEIMCSAEDIDNSYHFLDLLKSKNPSFYQDSTAQVLINTLRDEIVNRILFQEQVLSDQELIQKMAECMEDDMDGIDLKYEFNLFFCLQYFRSPKIHSNLSKSFEGFKKLYPASMKCMQTTIKY